MKWFSYHGELYEHCLTLMKEFHIIHRKPKKAYSLENIFNHIAQSEMLIWALRVPAKGEAHTLSLTWDWDEFTRMSTRLLP